MTSIGKIAAHLEDMYSVKQYGSSRRDSQSAAMCFGAGCHTIRYASLRNSSIFWRDRDGSIVGDASRRLSSSLRSGVRSVILACLDSEYVVMCRNTLYIRGSKCWKWTAWLGLAGLAHDLTRQPHWRTGNVALCEPQRPLPSIQPQFDPTKMGPSVQIQTLVTKIQIATKAWMTTKMRSRKSRADGENDYYIRICAWKPVSMAKLEVST